MPIQLVNSSFVDNFGNTTSQYKSNAGDEVTATYRLRSAIRMSSINNPLTRDPQLTQIVSASKSWVEEGFRIGQTVWISVFEDDGTVVSTSSTAILFVNDQILDLAVLAIFYDISLGQSMSVTAVNSASATDFKIRDFATLDVNHIQNSESPNFLSLIDGERTRFIFKELSTLTIGNTRTGVAVGNKSGQFVKEAKIKRITPTTGSLWVEHELEVTFVNSGLYDFNWFTLGDCLKVVKKLEWKVSENEPFSPTEFIYNEQANTGFFNQAHNISETNSTLVQGISEIDYCQPSSHTIIVDGATSGIGIGACYISFDDNYYKNKTASQRNITMLAKTTNVTTAINTSLINSVGAGFEIEIDSVVSVGSVTTIDFTITPNSAFDEFMSGRDEGDRLFNLWVKCGNINHLAFSDQLTCAPPVGGALTMVQDFGYLDHSQNVNSITGNSVNFEANTEDDLAYYGTFRLPKNTEIQDVTFEIEAFNTDTEESFSLQRTVFGFGAVQVSNQGIYLLNESATIVTNLLSDSVKKTALLQRKSDLDNTNNFGVSIYYPFLLNWKYWLLQTNANVDFYPYQNQNWQQYNDLGAWQLRTKLTAVIDGLSYVHTNVMIDKDYDSNPILENDISLEIAETEQTISVVAEGQMMVVTATHVRTDGSVWDTANVWGQITVEPKESAPRWHVSSVIPFDNNGSNPLRPLNGNLIEFEFPFPEKLVMKCYFNPNLINLENKVKFTSKIKQFCRPVLVQKMTTFGQPKTTTDDDFKRLA